MEYPYFEVEYEAKGQNSWERRMYAQGRISEDMTHGPPYSIKQIAVNLRNVRFIVEVEDELALSSDYFARAVDAKRVD
jgi:hypothetical protein